MQAGRLRTDREKYGVGLFGFDRGVPARRVVKIGFANLGISGGASLCLGLLMWRSNTFGGYRIYRCSLFFG